MSTAPSENPPLEPDRASKIRQRLRWIVGTSLLLGAGLYAASAIPITAVLRAVRAADLRVLAIAAVLVLVGCMGASSLRLWLLVARLPARAPVALPALTRLYLASSAAHHLLPSPAGEILRTRSLVRRHGYALGAVVACQVVEKAVDLLSLGLVLSALLLDPALPPSLRPAFALVAGLTAAGAVLGFVFARDRGALLALVGCSLLNDAAHVLSIALVLHAIAIATAPSACILAMAGTRVAALVPAAPGQLGVVEAAIAGALALYGVPLERAAAAAVLYRLVHFVPVLLAGASSWRSLSVEARA